jgi:hypothetical protein
LPQTQQAETRGGEARPNHRTLPSKKAAKVPGWGADSSNVERQWHLAASKAKGIVVDAHLSSTRGKDAVFKNAP